MPNYLYMGNPRLIEYLEPRLADAGFNRVADAYDAQYILTYCTSISMLEDMYFGDDGISQSVEGDCTIIDLSACPPNFANEINAVTTLSSINMVEAPMNVVNKVASDAFARENLTCFVGGEDEAIQAAREMLDAIFSRVSVVASAGVAQLAHIDETLRTVAEIVSVIEVSALVKHSKRTVSSLEFRDWTPMSTTDETKAVIHAIQEKNFECAYTCEMLMSEVSAAIMAADDYELILPQAESAFHLLELLAVIGGADKSVAALALVYEIDSNNEEYGLDWSRAENLYQNHEHNEDDVYDYFSEDDMYDEEDDYLDSTFGSSFDYSSN